jgi:long-chain acyl-CoA synthetase
LDHTGGIVSSLEMKLVSVKEMNYCTDSVDENGKSTPKGEICLRGPAIFAGYFNDIEKTKEAIDENGWLHTGDIGEMRADNGGMKIVDRIKNIFKLA